MIDATSNEERGKVRRFLSEVMKDVIMQHTDEQIILGQYNINLHNNTLMSEDAIKKILTIKLVLSKYSKITIS